MQPVKLSSSDVSLALRHSLCIMGSGRRAGMEYGCEWRGAQSPVGTWPRWAWTWEVSRDDWDLIYKPLKYFWFARQEIGSRHPLNVCVCVCMHSHSWTPRVVAVTSKQELILRRCRNFTDHIAWLLFLPIQFFVTWSIFAFWKVRVALWIIHNIFYIKSWKYVGDTWW